MKTIKVGGYEPLVLKPAADNMLDIEFDPQDTTMRLYPREAEALRDALIAMYPLEAAKPKVSYVAKEVADHTAAVVRIAHKPVEEPFAYCVNEAVARRLADLLNKDLNG